MLEDAIIKAVAPALAGGWMAGATPEQRLRGALKRVAVAATELRIDVHRAAVDLDAGLLIGHAGDDEIAAITVPIRLKSSQGAIVIESGMTTTSAGRVDRALVRAVVLAKLWARQLESGGVESIKALARQNGLCEHYTARLMPLAYLAPDLTAAILEGSQPASLSLKVLTQSSLPLSWEDQRRVFAS